MPFQFENLLVYRKALDFADEVCQLTFRFDRGFGFLADQLNRAALSVSTNLAEGNGRFTKADRRNFFTIARVRSKGSRDQRGQASLFCNCDQRGLTPLLSPLGR
jgi:hypothetical protein